jgi:hypothetical protein
MTTTQMTAEQMSEWITNSIESVKTEVAFGRLRVTVAMEFAREVAARLSRVANGVFDVEMIEVCIPDAPFRHVGSWTRNPAVDGNPSVIPVWTTVGRILRGED